MRHCIGEAKLISKDSEQGEQHTEYIQPDRRAHGILDATLQADLKERGGKSDRSDHHHIDRAAKCSPTRVEHDQGEGT